MKNLIIPNKDQFPLQAVAFLAEDEKHVLIINAALAVSQKYYEKFALYLNSRHITVYTYDYSNFGKSKSKDMPQYKPGMTEWAEKDFPALLDYAKTHHPNTPISVLGHSFGGQIIGLGYSQEANISSMVLVASQIGHPKYWTGAWRIQMYFLWYFFLPLVNRLFGKTPQWAGLGGEVSKEPILEWSKWGRSSDYLFSHLNDSKKEKYSQLDIPLLSYSFTDDNYAPLKGVNALLAKYKNALVEQKHLSPQEVGLKEIGHFGFFRSALQSAFWEQTADWVLQHPFYKNKLKPQEYENK